MLGFRDFEIFGHLEKETSLIKQKFCTKSKCFTIYYYCITAKSLYDAVIQSSYWNLSIKKEKFGKAKKMTAFPKNDHLPN